MDELRDRLQELADGYTRTTVPPGPAAARRRGRSRRRRTAAAAVVAGVLAIVAAVALLPALTAPPPAQPIGPAPTTPPPPRSTAWFRPAYVPGGYRLAVDKEWPMERLGPPLPAAQSFRTRHGNGQVTVGINPDLQQLDVAHEVRTYPTVRVVPVRGRSGLLFPRRQPAGPSP
jgi:hypothetical protein